MYTRVGQMSSIGYLFMIKQILKGLLYKLTHLQKLPDGNLRMETLCLNLQCTQPT